jgi:biopolymer transport protein ExbD
MAMTMAGAKGAARYALKQNSAINVTPFVDVMLVLLIVMMVTAPMATVAVNMDIPPTATPVSQVQPTFISITQTGLFLTTGASARPTNPNSLIADVGRALGPASAHPRVMLRADRHVRYRAFMDTVNRLKAAGYDRIGLISENLR